jgi:Xaa-Pro aminopeptidase
LTPRDATLIKPIINKLDVDGLLLLSPQSYIWATGFRVTTHAMMRWRYAAALLVESGIDSLLSVDMEATTVAGALPEPALYVWREFSNNAMEVLARMITERLPRGPLRLGIETDFVPTGVMEQLRGLLPEVTWVPCESEIAQARIAKDPNETARIRDLVTASDDALAEALAGVQVGQTEFEVGERIISSLYSTGVNEHKVLIVASGPRTQYPNVPPSGRAIEYGDLLRVEVFGGADGYQAGVARTAVVGEPSAEAARLWEFIRASRTAGLEALRPGAKPSEVYAAYVDALGPLRQYAIAFWAHGMGLDVHEPPYISAESTDELLEGAILGIEPYAMIPGKFGLQIKDVVSITASGYEILSHRLDGGELHVVGT